jgi:hypothetical protein
LEDEMIKYSENKGLFVYPLILNFGYNLSNGNVYVLHMVLGLEKELALFCNIEIVKSSSDLFFSFGNV